MAVEETKQEGDGVVMCRPLDRKAWLKGREVIEKIQSMLDNERIPHKGVLKRVRGGGGLLICCLP